MSDEDFIRDIEELYQHILKTDADDFITEAKNADLDLKNDLVGANLRGTNLSGSDLSKANLNGTDLSQSDISRANLRGAILIGANLSEADLSGADLRGANLKEADLFRANLKNTQIDHRTIIDEKWLLAWTLVNNSLQENRQEVFEIDISHQATDSQNYFLGNINNLIIVKENFSNITGTQYNLTTETVIAIEEIDKLLQRWQNENLNATESEAQNIIEAEITSFKTEQPNKWQTLVKQLLNKERWINGGRASLFAIAEHYLDNNVVYKAGLAFLDDFSSTPDKGD